MSDPGDGARSTTHPPMLLISKTTPGVVSVVLDRPDKRNALSPELVAQLTRTFADAGSDPSTRVIVLAGAGPSFCAGGDIDSLVALAHMSEAATAADAQSFIDLFRTVSSSPLPVIARVQGAALGGGTALAACADIVVAAASATFGCTEVRVGIVPSIVAPFIVARVGWAATRRLMVTGERIHAAEALRLGLVDEVCDDSELDSRVAAVTATVLSGNREAQTAVKVLLRELEAGQPADVERLTLEATVRARMSPAGRRAMSEFLASRRRPET
jgi:methylglutaconyl-CoA hydratase